MQPLACSPTLVTTWLLHDVHPSDLRLADRRCPVSIWSERCLSGHVRCRRRLSSRQS